MRQNLPITENEVVLAEGRAIVSKTDPKGIITYINNEFCNISGYTQEELVGKPQNIVRHPDMPEAVFRELWETIQKGKPWSGIVKNRTKDGGFYWVDSTISPIYEKSIITGYISIRSRPEASQIERAQTMYTAMNAGKFKPEKIPFLNRFRISNLFLYFSIVICVLNSASLVSLLIGYKKLNERLNPSATGNSPFAGFIQHFLDDGFFAAGIIISLFTVIFVLLLSSILIASLRDRMRQIIDYLRELTSGNLKVFIKMDSKGNVGQIFHEMEMVRLAMKSLIAHMVGNSQFIISRLEGLQEVTNKIKNAFGELNYSMEILTESSAFTSSNTVEAFDQMRKLNELIQSMALVSQQAYKSAETTQTTILHSSETSDNVISQIHHAKDSVALAAQNIQSLEEQAKNITKIVTVISSIYDQTNLLALNAAIEAARAGEAGAGFSVVASEVGKLAEQSSKSVKNIASSINSINLKIKEVVGEIMDGVNQVSEGTFNLENVKNALESIKSDSQKTTENITTIFNSTSEISKMSEFFIKKLEIISSRAKGNSSIIEEVSSDSQNNFESVQQIDETVKTMLEISTDLQSSTNNFKF